MIVESQIFVTIFNAVVNVFVHETFVRLFLPDWCLKEKLMGQNAQKLIRVVTDICWQSSFQEDRASLELQSMMGWPALFSNRKKSFQFLERCFKCSLYLVLKNKVE